MYQESPATHAAAVTPSDTVALDVPRSIYVGGSGVGTSNLAVKLGEDTVAVTLANVADGSVLPIRPKYVMSTNTTATNIVAFY